MVTGYLVLRNWGGPYKQKVEIVGITPKRYRIRAILRTKLAGRYRWLEIGQTTLIPKHAIRDNCRVCGGVRGGMPGNENIVAGLIICDYCHADDASRVKEPGEKE